MDSQTLRLVSSLGSRMQAKSCYLLETDENLRNIILPDLTGNGRRYLPIHVAGFDGQVEVMEKLMELGIDPSVKEPTHLNWTPLHFAAQHHHDEIASILIKAGANVNATDLQGKTPLHWSAINNSAEVAQVLVDQGAALSMKDNDGFTAVDYAGKKNNLEVALVLNQAINV